ncbi:hypothetical protein HAX54_041232 [Datura stramonium]|uniref:Pentatricopeptide repeat-containing protein n=1 Tax=Datura stramonium TaxID=4076 RepID=A0ABS8VTZ0_DATST|nr:hypothetical protein [Datura stramonium]
MDETETLPKLNPSSAVCLKNIVSWTAMLTAYSQNRQLKKARELFDKMPERSIASWNAMLTESDMAENLYSGLLWFSENLAMIDGYSKNGRVIEAGSCLISEGEMRSLGKLVEDLTKHQQGYQIHGLVSRLGFEFDISAFVQAGNLEEGYELFKRAPQKDVVSWTAMITGFLEKGEYEEAFRWFIKMLQSAVRPNPLTLSSMLSSSAGLAMLNQGLQIHALVLKMDMEGSIAYAWGLVEEGWNYFKSMRSLYNIEPDHYTSMVDILGRAGLLDEAVSLINSMPFKTHSGVWGAILSASKTHLRLDLYKACTAQSLDLEPSSAAPYVVLSDLYW